MAVITKRGFPPVAATIGSYAAQFGGPAGANGVVLDDAIQPRNGSNQTRLEYLLQGPDSGDAGARFNWRSMCTVTPVEQMVRTLLPYMPPLTRPSR
ncbi:MAG: hypothetical protein EOS54_09660 [Mesorhizobium sp.]|uniref:hypothetical protein n=1 Tax=unclassified Mesorhizobium TaxID=325217 RepID=UPI000F7585D2|nr:MULTISPECIES: hypothetical protein [unclassified Mesorhizobium]AZO47237.1 hypothetical protein EJ073_04880 [Mesorhizobium sp. M4B.F.Ca.ET.058.02.1.1]RWC54778.1 MAG: hypothetical protein EOS54_09660 [Mesorhizobium sp.]RWD13974.1 MAG: hypothetical protein EOS74_18460 [Mesorhizobium sp.]RWD55687.1 MAG: hypothetical protein EOS75_17185 [Mesorhizobium sp.]TIW13885.1 MAG: hypothetical protein E5V66_01885 [Mesorhizobium sp.]